MASAVRLVNPVSLGALGTLLACGFALLLTDRRGPARRCIRCGRPFCHYCKSGREGQEYCSQCHHLFVLGDGLAPETKTRKIWEVERYERTRRRLRGLASWLLPGSAQVLNGHAVRGGALLLGWLAALIAWQPGVLAPIESLGGIRVGFDLMRRSTVPAMYEINAVSVIAVCLLALVWILGNVWRVGRGEA